MISLKQTERREENLVRSMNDGVELYIKDQVLEGNEELERVLLFDLANYPDLTIKYTLKETTFGRTFGVEVEVKEYLTFLKNKGIL